jgi:hypothetical protein
MISQRRIFLVDTKPTSSKNNIKPEHSVPLLTRRSPFLVSPRTSCPTRAHGGGARIGLHPPPRLHRYKNSPQRMPFPPSLPEMRSRVPISSKERSFVVNEAVEAVAGLTRWQASGAVGGGRVDVGGLVL